MKLCSTLDARKFENINGKESCHEGRRQEYGRQDQEHHNGPTFLSSFQYPIPRNANLGGIGMPLLQVKCSKQVITNALSPFTHTVNVKKFGAGGFPSPCQILQRSYLHLSPRIGALSSLNRRECLPKLSVSWNYQGCIPYEALEEASSLVSLAVA